MRPKLSRGEFLRLTAGAASSGLFVGLPASIDASWLMGEQATGSAGEARAARIAQVIADYDGQGNHRTATATDNTSADWLLDQARRAGAAAMLESFAIARVDVHAAYLESDGRRVEGLPLFDGAFSDEGGISGRLGPPEAKPSIALVTLNAGGISSEGQSLATLRRSAQFRAIVAITQGAHAGLSPSNAASFTAPYGVPVLQVSSEDAAWLTERSGQQRDVRLVAHATRTPSRASNVVATLPGRESALSPVVVITPRSGWWRCAGERGGGIACWLETLRAAAGNTRRPMWFVASSGHELGHLGLDAFIESRPGLIKAAAAWIHLGANIGVAGGAARLQASDDQIAGIADAALANANAVVQLRVARGTVPAGEARNIHVGGGRYVSLLGTSPFFHSPADRWPIAVDVPAVARFAAAVADVATGLGSDRA